MAAMVAAPAAAIAQVLEIGEGGDVAVYDRPAVFVDGAVTPIVATTRAGSRAQAPRRLPTTALAEAAIAAELSPNLLAAVAWRESGFRSDAISRAGAIGEMQLMPATAYALGVDPRDPAQNLRGGATYLSSLMHRYDGDLVRALAAYNAGPGAVDRFGGVPPFRETRAYVAAILDRLSQISAPLVLADARR